MQPCLFCDGDASEPDHWLHCCGQQGRVEATEPDEPEDEEPPPPRAVARTTDPETSHAAAASLSPETLTAIQCKVAVALEHYGGDAGLPDVLLVDGYRESYGWAGSSTIRTRRRELVELGLVEDTGRRVQIRSRRLAIVWRVVRSNGKGNH